MGGGKKKKGGGGRKEAGGEEGDGKAAKPLKIAGPTHIHMLRGRLLGRNVALLSCGESHEDWIDITREKCIVESEEGWVKMPCEDGHGFSPEDRMASQEGLTLATAKKWAERILDRAGSEGSDSDSGEEVEGGFLVFVKEESGAKARGSGFLYSADAKRSAEHPLPSGAAVFEWEDLDAVAREFNKRRLAGEHVPFAEQDAMAAERKALRRKEGIELFDDWLVRHATSGEVDLHVVLEASVPVSEVELHVDADAPPMPAAPRCIRGLEADSDTDEEDAADPADGCGTFLDYLGRRLMANLAPGRVLHIDPRDLGDSNDEGATGDFHALLPEPLAPDPDERLLDEADAPPMFEEEEEEEEVVGNPKKRPVPSWEAYFSAAAELLYYSPQIKADFAPLLARCLRSPEELRRFMEALYFRTVPEAVAILGGMDAERLAYTRIRSPIYEDFEQQQGMKRRPDGGTFWVEHMVPISAAPVGCYLKAKGSEPPRTWVSGLVQRLEGSGAEEIVAAAKSWFSRQVEYLLSDPKSSDTEGDYFCAWLRACHREIYDDIDRSDPAELARAAWAASDAHPRSKKHRHRLKEIAIPDVDGAFRELNAFDPDARISTKRERVLAMILLDCFQLRMVDLAAALRVADAILSSPPGADVVVVLYAGGDHANCVADFWRAHGFSSQGLPKKGFLGKEDWDEDEPHTFFLPPCLHDLKSLFPLP